MTDDEVRREILHAIVECEVEDGRGNPMSGPPKNSELRCLMLWKRRGCLKSIQMMGLRPVPA
jgi:hypothetical protein